jgi:hypothetical protein
MWKRVKKNNFPVTVYIYMVHSVKLSEKNFQKVEYRINLLIKKHVFLKKNYAYFIFKI